MADWVWRAQVHPVCQILSKSVKWLQTYHNFSRRQPPAAILKACYDVIWHIDRQNWSTGVTCGNKYMYVCAHNEETKKWKKCYIGKLVVCPNHPCHLIEIQFGMLVVFGQYGSKFKNGWAITKMWGVKIWLMTLLWPLVIQQHTGVNLSLKCLTCI